MINAVLYSTFKSTYIYVFIWPRQVFLTTLASFVVAWGLSFSTACEILVPQPRIKPASLALWGGFLTTEPPGKFLCPTFVLPFFFENFLMALKTLKNKVPSMKQALNKYLLLTGYASLYWNHQCMSTFLSIFLETLNVIINRNFAGWFD